MVWLRLPTGDFHIFHRFNGGLYERAFAERSMECSSAYPETMATQSLSQVAVIWVRMALSVFVVMRYVAAAFHRVPPAADSWAASGVAVIQKLPSCHT